MALEERKETLKLLNGYKCKCLLCKYESEPNITPLLAQVSTLYTHYSYGDLSHSHLNSFPNLTDSRYACNVLPLSGPNRSIHTLW